MTECWTFKLLQCPVPCDRWPQGDGTWAHLLLEFPSQPLCRWGMGGGTTPSPSPSHVPVQASACLPWGSSR